LNIISDALAIVADSGQIPVIMRIAVDDPTFA
jgi:hypothetical protein